MALSVHSGSFDDEYEKHSKIKQDYGVLDSITPEYRIPVLAINKGKTGKVKLNIKLSSKAKKDKNLKIIFEASEKEKIEINNKEEFIVSTSNIKDIENLSIKAINYIKNSELDNIYITAKLYGKTIGKLKYYCAEPVTKEVKLVFVKSDSKGYREIDETSLLNYLNTKSLNQLFVKIEFLKTEKIDVTGFNETQKNKLFSGSTNERFYVLARHYNNLESNFLEKENDTFFIINFEYKRKNKEGEDEEVGGIHRTGESGGVLFVYKDDYDEATAHELGHWIGLEHPKNDVGHRKIPEYKSQNNFMDYEIKRKSWFWHQLINKN